MILKKELVRLTSMAGDLVNTLAKFRIPMLRRQELGPHSYVARVPGLPTVIGAINSSSGDRNVHPFFVSRIRKDRMETQTAATRLPLRPMRMIVKTSDQGPAFAGIVRTK